MLICAVVAKNQSHKGESPLNKRVTLPENKYISRRGCCFDLSSSVYYFINIYRNLYQFFYLSNSIYSLNSSKGFNSSSSLVYCLSPGFKISAILISSTALLRSFKCTNIQALL